MSIKAPRSQIIEWAPYLLQLTIADMGINFGGSATAVAQQLLDMANIRTTFEQVGCIAVPQPMLFTH
jgi:hypothetical protein